MMHHFILDRVIHQTKHLISVWFESLLGHSGSIPDYGNRTILFDVC
jgi:hypothetical protein